MIDLIDIGLANDDDGIPSTYRYQITRRKIVKKCLLRDFFLEEDGWAG